jgi:hypothetical protein
VDPNKFSRLKEKSTEINITSVWPTKIILFSVEGQMEVLFHIFITFLLVFEISKSQISLKARSRESHENVFSASRF